jgi:hypothetical protein
MLPKNSAAAGISRFPQAIEFGDGNMGIRNFRPPRINKSAAVFGVPLNRDTPLQLELSDKTAGISNAQFWIILHSETAAQQQPEIEVNLNGRNLSGQTEHLINGWRLYRSAATATAVGDKLNISGDSPTTVAAVRLVSDKKLLPLFNAWQDDKKKLCPAAPFSSRWTSETSEFLTPTSTNAATYLLTFTLAPSEWGDAAKLSLYGESTQKTTVPTDSFVWEVWSVGSEHKTNTASIRLESSAAETPSPTNLPAVMPVNIAYAVAVKAKCYQCETVQ